MPFYEYKCKSCDKTVEMFCSMQEKESKLAELKCECGKPISANDESLGAAGYAFADPIGTDRWVSDSHGHDYRFKYNLPNVLREREMAERNSHMGKTPYGCVDVPITPERL